MRARAVGYAVLGVLGNEPQVAKTTLVLANLNSVLLTPHVAKQCHGVH
jgi:phosphoglycerate dehydrogenase-like enzyme